MQLYKRPTGRREGSIPILLAITLDGQAICRSIGKDPDFLQPKILGLSLHLTLRSIRIYPDIFLRNYAEAK